MKDFAAMRRTLEREFFSHPVIQANPYTAWLSRGTADDAQVEDLILQFSVFSNHFLVAQVKRMVNAATLEGESCARSILVNECGVGLDARTGSAEGRVFTSANAHLNWLRELGAELGLAPMALGRWDSALPSTKRFLLELERSYGSRDGQVGAGASFAIETWAAFGLGCGAEQEARNFWCQLIRGLEAHNENWRRPRGLSALPLSFFKYHRSLETGHGAGVWAELEKSFAEPGFDAARFLKGGKRALNAIHTFWLGLDESRRRLDSGRRDSVLDGVNIAQWAL